MSTVSCDNVSVRYIKGDFKSIGLKEYVIRRLTGNYRVEEFWADKNITFSLDEGDMLGIIGSNGAGKSTLLKAITGILLPAEGSIYTKGKIAALLELTSGFDRDMTVRENTYLRGAMLGYTKAFIDEKYDEIIDFAELRKFEDYPFKQLSSGMRSRLAFAIGCLVEPDILILDEVLSVGDGAFRQKSGEKMREILNSGITAILVSHSIKQIRELATKILWIDHGNQIAFSDDVELYCNAYEQFMNTGELPETEEDVYRMSKEFEAGQNQKAVEKKQEEVRKLELLLEEGGEEAVRAAIEVIRKREPQLLDGARVREYL